MKIRKNILCVILVLFVSCLTVVSATAVVTPCTHIADNGSYEPISDSRHALIVKCTSCGAEMSRTEDSCTFNNGLCVCGNTNGSCLHENSTVTYESLSSDSHTVITTCNDCGYVSRDTQGCSAHGITKTFATPVSSITHNEEIRCECGNLRETRKNVSCYFVVDGNKCNLAGSRVEATRT